MNWMHYLLEANLYLVAFYALYLLFFRSQTHYQLNRAYLLITSTLAFIVPLIKLGFLVKPAEYASAQITMGTIGEPVATYVQVADTRNLWTMDNYILLIYGLVAFALLISLSIKVYLLISLSKKGAKSRAIGFNIIELQGSAAFSFFNNLFIDNRLISSRTILYHEQVHIRQKHSWDVIYFEVLKIINWFNPVIYLVIASIKEVHEFIADEETVRLESNNNDYTDFLISNAYGITQSSLTNSFFNKNLLKRRITMLYQKKSGKAAKLKYLLTIPLICGLLCISTLAFTTKTYALVIAPYKMTASPDTFNKTQSSAVEEYARGWHAAEDEYKKTHPVAKADTGKIFKAVDKLPEFPGGWDELGQFLTENIRYPKTDHDNGVQGRVFVRFVIEKDGRVTDTKVMRTPSAAMGDEALRVVNMLPKWSPGLKDGKPVRTMFTLPVNFSLSPPQSFKGQNEIAMEPAPEKKDNNPRDPNAVYTAVEIQPEFPGGKAAFGRFLAQNIRYPALAKQNKIQGRVFVQFVVEKDGSLSDIKVIREPGSGTGDEAVRVMKLSPKWNPGKQNGQAARVQFTLPINFVLSDASDNAGYNSFSKFIQTYVRYPTKAKDNGIQGRVFIQFNVNDDKHIQNIKVLRSPDESLSTEVVRVLQKFDQLPEAKPNVNYVIVVCFNISNGDGDTQNAKKTEPATPYIPKDGDRVMLNEVVVTTYKSAGK